MKKITLLFLLTTSMYSQNDFIITNNGEKIEVEDTTIIINYLDKAIEYKSLEKNRTKTIDFSDFSYCYFEGYVFMTFDLNKNKSIKGYFVIADSKNRKLLSVVLPPDADDYNKFKNQTVKYEYVVIDENTNILERYTFDNIKIETNKTVRSLLPIKLKNQFKDFPEFLDRLKSYENVIGDNDNLKILELFEFPSYMKKTEKI
jgi:hypothetical protein